MAEQRMLRARLDENHSQALKSLAKLDGEAESVIVRRLIREEYKRRATELQVAAMSASLQRIPAPAGAGPGPIRIPTE